MTKMFEKVARLAGVLRMEDQEIARALGMSKSSYSKLQARDDPRLRPWQFLALARTLRTSVAFLCDDDLDHPPPPELSVDEAQVVGLMRDHKLSYREVLNFVIQGMRGRSDAGDPPPEATVIPVSKGGPPPVMPPSSMVREDGTSVGPLLPDPGTRPSRRRSPGRKTRRSTGS
jgi:hypothetical protein